MTQAELRAELLAILRGRSTEPVAQCHAEDIAALFAARVAAIEDERDEANEYYAEAVAERGEWDRRLTEAEVERDRFREHSVQLNTVGWKLAEAVGDVGAADTEVDGDRLERLARLVAERDKARAELSALQQRVAEMSKWTRELIGLEPGHPVEDYQTLLERVAKLTAERNVYLARSVALEHELAGVAAERTQAAARTREQATGESYSPAEITAAVIAVREFFPRIPTGNLIEELRVTRALLTADVPATPQELHGSTQESKARLGAPTPASSMGSAGEADIDPDGEAAHRQAPVTPEEPPQPAERNPDGSRIGGFCRDCADGPPYCPECPLHVSGEVSDERG